MVVIANVKSQKERLELEFKHKFISLANGLNRAKIVCTTMILINLLTSDNVNLFSSSL